MRTATTLSFGIIVFTLLLAGCGERLASVGGKVTFDGQPLAGGPGVRAMIQFQPESGGAPAIGNLDADGNYELVRGSQAGLPPGPYLVTVTASKIIPGPTPYDPGSGKPITPRRYASAKESGLRADVQAGSNTFDFALESGKGA